MKLCIEKSSCGLCNVPVGAVQCCVELLVPASAATYPEVGFRRQKQMGSIPPCFSACFLVDGARGKMILRVDFKSISPHKDMVEVFGQRDFKAILHVFCR